MSFVLGADDRVEFYSPFFIGSTERGWLEVTKTDEYYRLFRAA